MTIGRSINKLRTNANLSQEQFATLFNVSQQSVQKWENGDSAPSLDKIIKISKHFGVSLDALILNNDNRVVEEMGGTKQITPQYENMNCAEFYSSNLLVEYDQSMDEGLDIEAYKDIISAISMLPQNEIKKKFGDIIFDIVKNAKKRPDYEFIEPSELEAIKQLRIPYSYKEIKNCSLKDKIHGAWVGRVCGCMLGKPVEGIRTEEFIPFLKETKNYPLQRYVYRKEITDDVINRYTFCFNMRKYADEIDGMPPDDDINYTVLYQEIIEKYGKDFTPFDVSRAWLDYQRKDAYFSAERVAYINFIKGFAPPESAVYKNPYREWIGAQIRADYFGFINPGNPEKAAEMAWRDASISHIKNGIYGEMFVSAMLAVATKTNNIKDIILGGLAEIPHTSRLYMEIMNVLNDFENNVSKDEAFKIIHTKFDEHTSHGWCHTISNAMIVVASLLYGGGDYAKSICMSVETGFDTDCNGATVGSILGMANGINSIPEYWKNPINNTIYTTIFGLDKISITDRVDMTLKHINN